MGRETPPKSWLEVAALARMAQLTEGQGRREMKSEAEQADREIKVETRKAWAMGDYGRFATELIWDVGPVVVEAAGVRPGMRVLDVAAGTGNSAIRAAQAGAQVVASDLTPENFPAGRRIARDRGVELEWVEADAESLPFADGEFDAVMSSFGAIFAPKHERVADEMLRVCKPGGTIAMANFTPEGVAADFFAVFVPYMPPPREGDQPPVLWGSEEHVRELFGDRVSSLEVTPMSYVERAASPQAYCDFIKETFGPVAAIYRNLEDRPSETAALDEAFLRFAEGHDRGRPGEGAEYPYEYVVVAAQKRAG